MNPGWKKYRNYLAGKPVEAGNYLQERLIEKLKFPELVELMPWENHQWNCPRCLKLCFARIHCDQYGFAKIVTPRNYTCTKCGMTAFFFRGNPWEFDLDCWDNDSLMRWFSNVRFNELDYISSEDPLKYYLQIQHVTPELFEK